MTPEVRGLISRMAEQLDQFVRQVTDNRCLQSDLATEARAFLAQPEWRPMETAPTDGTLILAHDYDTIACVLWDGVEWDADGICFFSAGWQYLPEIPEVPQ